MNYSVEIFIYWALMCTTLFVLFVIESVYTKNILKKRLIGGNRENHTGILKYLSTKGWLDTIRALLILFLIIVLSWGITFPTHFSVPTVRITAQGDIIPLPYGAWEWKRDKNSLITRLEPSVACDALLNGRTEDNIFIEAYPAKFLHGITFRIENFKTFYHYYKTEGKGGFCREVNEVMLNEVFYGKTILPKSNENIASADERQLTLRNKVIQKLAETFANKGVIVVAK